MRVMCVDNVYGNNKVSCKAKKITTEIIERANEATMHSGNYSGTYRSKTILGNEIISESHPDGGISIKIRDKWGKIISDQNITLETIKENFGKAYDKVMGRK